MTHAERARRYLQASMNAGYTGLPAQHREAYEAQMRSHERAYSKVREHAIIATNQDFDKPLTAGEREHQQHLRDREGLTMSQLAERRKSIRESAKPTRPQPQRPGALRTGARAGRSYYRSRRAARQLGVPADLGSTMLEAIGMGLGLVLLYLVLSPNGSKAFAALLNGISSALRLFVAPVDPLNPKGLTSTSSSSSVTITKAGLSQNTTPAPTLTPAQRKHVGPAFGPGPGIGSPLQPAAGGGR